MMTDCAREPEKKGGGGPRPPSPVFNAKVEGSLRD